MKFVGALMTLAVAANAASLTSTMEKYAGAGIAHKQDGNQPSFWYDCLVIKRSGTSACLTLEEDGRVVEKDCPAVDEEAATWRAIDDSNYKTHGKKPRVRFLSNTTPEPDPKERTAESPKGIVALTYNHRENRIVGEDMGDVKNIDEVTGILMRQSWQVTNIGGGKGKTISVLDARLLQAQLPKKHAHDTHVDHSHDKRSDLISVTIPHYMKNHHVSESHQNVWNICKCPSRGGCTETF